MEKQLAEWKEEYPLWYVDNEEEGFKPQKLIEYIHQFTKGEAIVATDVGQHQMWSAQFYPFQKADKWVTSGGLGTMGFGLPAAIGAQLAEKDATVVAVVGDGGFQMTLQELDVIRELNLPVKVVILNNACLGMVRQWQEISMKNVIQNLNSLLSLTSSNCPKHTALKASEFHQKRKQRKSWKRH